MVSLNDEQTFSLGSRGMIPYTTGTGRLINVPLTLLRYKNICGRLTALSRHPISS